MYEPIPQFHFHISYLHIEKLLDFLVYRYFL